MVGAGVGGLSTAVGLRRAGWTVRVLERWPAVVGSGAALGLWPEASRGLESLGLTDLVAESVPVNGAAVYRSDGRALLHVPDGSRRIPAVRLISRRRLMELLVGLAADVDVRTGVAADAATLHAALDEADVLIGADGLRSDVRRVFFGERTTPRYSGLVAWRGAVDFASGQYGETWGDGTLFGNTPMAGGRTNFYAALRTSPDDNRGLAGLRSYFARWRSPIPEILAAAREDELLRNPVYDLHPPLRSLVAGRVALVGDAAHAMTPHLGRGACEAILDATSLVEQLVTSPDVEAALARYDAARRRAGQRIAARSRRTGRITHATGVGAALRNGMLRGAGLLAR